MNLSDSLKKISNYFFGGNQDRFYSHNRTFYRAMQVDSEYEEEIKNIDLHEFTEKAVKTSCTILEVAILSFAYYYKNPILIGLVAFPEWARSIIDTERRTYQNILYTRRKNILEEQLQD